MKKQILLLFAALMLSLGATAQMVLQFNTNLSDGKTITLPLYGDVNATVDWGDGSSDTYTEAGNQDHTYATEGTYTVEISGSLTQFGQYNYPNADKLVKVTSFGDIGLTSLENAFHNAVNLVEVPTQLPSSVKVLQFTFRDATNFNFDISGWDVSNVGIMRGLFRGASSFNQDISNWDVSNVGNMSYMFFNAIAFNQDISNWDVSNVGNMSDMFFYAIAFNQDIGNWDVSKAYSMSSMFNGATSFNQNIGSWNVGKVTSMSYMFREATAFNQDISGWDVSKVYNMNYMFEGCASFNQDISGWDVSKVLEMPSMFSNATAFNQDLGSWNVTSVTNMTDMFAEVTLSTANYNSLLIGWAAQTVKNGVVFSGGNSKYSPGAAADARAVLTGATNNWTITDGGQLSENAMVLEFNTHLSEGTTITLPLNGAVNVTVNWGDGSSNTYTTEGNKNHTYTAEGYYTVEISGSLTQFGNIWNAYPNVDKLVRVTSFGNIGLTSLNGAFIQAIKLIEVPDMLPSSVTSTFRMFKGAKSFNQDISGWDVSSVIEMGDMFEGATSFNQDIGSWNVSNVKYMNNMFKGVTLSTANYNSLLIGWAAQTVQNGVYFHGGNSQYSPGAAADARAVLTGATNNWTIYDGGQLDNPNAMILKFDTYKSEGTTITLPLYGTVDVTVDWGDGNTDAYTTAGNHDHTYATEGTYTVSIDGNLTQFGNNWPVTPNIDKLIAVTSFGDLGLTSLFRAFYKAVNLTQVPTTLPSTVTNTVSLFGGATNFNQDIGGWDVSNVTNMRSMFAEATAFNQNIGSWNVSNVTDMESMFYRATAFNQDIGSWDVGNVTDMESMFYRATAFNQDIGNWDVGKVTSLFCMFCEASAFNQNIGSWNVSKVTDMFYMFKNATTFNQNLGGWDVSKVTDMEGMFAEVTLSTANYNSLLIGWAAQTVQNGVVFSGGNSKYSPGAAADARAVLTGATNGWTITDGGESSVFTVSTLAVSDIAATSATAGGNITADGGSSPITVRGVVWGTTANPTIANNTGITTDGSGTGTFTSSITGLTENTTYHVRAYATNADGTEYGENREFTTKKGLGVTGTFTVNSKTYDGTTDATINANNLSLSGVIAEAPDVSIGEVTIAFNSKEVADSKAVSITHIELLGTDANKYHFDITGAPTSTANITAKELTVGGSFTVADKEYDGTTAATITANNLTLSTPITGDEVSLTNVVATFESKDAGEGIKVSITAAQLNGTDKGNYSISFVGAPTATATISDGTVNYPVTFTVTHNSEFVEGATISINSQKLTTNTVGVATIELANGVYPYTVSASGYVFYEGSITVSGAAVNQSVPLAQASAKMELVFNTNKSSGTTVTLPLQGTVNATVNWGDGSSDTYTEAGNQDHTYAAEGTYTVEISGSLTQFGNGWTVTPNLDKLVAVTSFGDIGLTSLTGAFRSALNLTQAPTTLPSTVTNTGYMFSGCTSFNQDISSWDVSKVTNMTDMFAGVTLSTANYNSLLIGWAAQTVQNGVVFSGGNSKYSPGAAADARAVLTGAMNNWTITDGGESIASAVNSTLAETMGVYPNPFQNTINITNADNAKRVVITNIVGKVVMVVDLNKVPNPVIETNLPSGIYMVTLIANDGSRVVRKMMRE